MVVTKALGVSRPLCIDLFCGLGGWADGFLIEGWDVIGFDIERHLDQHGYGYPGQLVLQDILTMVGSQLVTADAIVASPPCQNYSYMAMPWKRAKQMAADIRADPARLAALNTLYAACFRIQAEASAAAGRHIPMVVENVKGAQPWVGKAKAHYGSYYLWGDVESIGGRILIGRPGFGTASLSPTRRGTKNAGGSWFAVAHNTESGHGRNLDGRKNPGQNWSNHSRTGEVSPHWNVSAMKGSGGSWFGHEHGHTNGARSTPTRGREDQTIAARYDPRDIRAHRPAPATDDEGAKQAGSGPLWFDHGIANLPSRSARRKLASALIAKIPLPLARFVAAGLRPEIGSGSEI